MGFRVRIVSLVIIGENKSIDLQDVGETGEMTTMTSTPQTKAGKMEGKSTLSVLKVFEGINVSHLTTVAPQMISLMPPPLNTVIRVKLGGTAYLPLSY